MGTQYTVEQGDCLASIAKRFGILDWRTIYDGPANARFRQKHPDPNVICPGDSLSIPDFVTRTEPVASEQRHTFELSRKKTFLRLVLRDNKGQPLASAKYRLAVEGLIFPIDAITGDDGLIEHEIPADAQTGKLGVLPPGSGPNAIPLTLNLRIGHLDPVKTVKGIQARLNNLGFFSGFPDGIIGPITRAAVKSFQAANHLDVDGDPGPITQGKLKELHGY